MRIHVDESIRADRAVLHALVEAGFRGVRGAGAEIHIERAVRPEQSFAGRAYPEVPARAPTEPESRYLVRLFLPATLRNRGYPKTYHYTRRKTAPWITVGDWQERVVALVAHEAFHVHQFREGLRRSEVQAERWAAGVLAGWRSGRGARIQAAPEPRAAADQLCFEW